HLEPHGGPFCQRAPEFTPLLATQLADEESLPGFPLAGDQQLASGLLFNALRHDVQPQAVAEFDHGPHDGGAPGVGRHLANQGLVDRQHSPVPLFGFPAISQTHLRGVDTSRRAYMPAAVWPTSSYLGISSSSPRCAQPTGFPPRRVEGQGGGFLAAPDFSRLPQLSTSQICYGHPAFLDVTRSCTDTRWLLSSRSCRRPRRPGLWRLALWHSRIG